MLGVALEVHFRAADRKRQNLSNLLRKALILRNLLLKTVSERIWLPW